MGGAGLAFREVRRATGKVPDPLRSRTAAEGPLGYLSFRFRRASSSSSAVLNELLRGGG